MKPEKINKIFRTLLIVLFIIFISLFISGTTGYYEYGQYKKVALTNEQIKKFEKDIKDGKNIDIKDYVKETKVDYGNKVSKTGLKISKQVEKYVKKFINSSFKVISGAIND